MSPALTEMTNAGTGLKKVKGREGIYTLTAPGHLRQHDGRKRGKGKAT